MKFLLRNHPKHGVYIKLKLKYTYINVLTQSHMSTCMFDHKICVINLNKSYTYEHDECDLQGYVSETLFYPAANKKELNIIKIFGRRQW